MPADVSQHGSWPAPLVDAPLRHNVELKARLVALEPAHEVARHLPAAWQGMLEQRDTYFCVSQGRLKLREIQGQTAQLIGYDRPDQAAAKDSLYRIAPVHDAPTLLAILRTTLGIQTIIEKRRELYLYQNVRIHLDEVRHLGRFLEFEAVLDGPEQRPAGQQRVAELADRFGIRPVDLVSGSYAELLQRIVESPTDS